MAAEAAFRSRLAELGATPLYDRWLGSVQAHHVRCINGHDCYSRPNDLQQGDGLCRACAGRDPVLAERAFLARLEKMGATPLYDRWLGTGAGHYVRCASGHDCYPWPSTVRDGGGICRTCAGLDPVACEARFRTRLAELGAKPLYVKWLGNGKPHEVRCSAGHECQPRPSDVLQGAGICRVCRGAIWDAFYVTASPVAVKFGVTSGDPRPRLRVHAAHGYTRVMRRATGLPENVAPDTERAIIAALAMAGEKPVKGREYFDISCLALILDVADSWLPGGSLAA